MADGRRIAAADAQGPCWPLLPLAVDAASSTWRRAHRAARRPAAVALRPRPRRPEAQAAAPGGRGARAEARGRRPRPAGRTPGFDVVRVEPDGSAAVVGTAEPGAKVTIYADEAPLAEAEADAEGNFVAIFKVEPSPEPRALTLGAVTPEGAAAVGGRGDAAAAGAGRPGARAGARGRRGRGRAGAGNPGAEAASRARGGGRPR